MTTAGGGDRLTIAAAVVGAAAWAATLSGRLAMAVAADGSAPTPVVWLAWPRGDARLLRWYAGAAAVVLTAIVVARIARRRWAAVATAIVAVALVIPASSVPYPGAAATFDLMRASLAAVPIDPAVESAAPERHLSLPDNLSAASVDGTVDVDTTGSVFVPQWTALIDDAGGFWFAPAGSPQGRDMRGMSCADPIRVAAQWWACGMQIEPGPHW
ncbi:hypothetical protein [Isoptericola sp. NPDC057191]|uniref:hypothetical protein n=1 Tax=Isoptericola sp. NPDC057191 TaxID=3346041 RepID=UPI0036385E08